jgi:hypothetical protein
VLHLVSADHSLKMAAQVEFIQDKRDMGASLKLQEITRQVAKNDSQASE